MTTKRAAAPRERAAGPRRRTGSPRIAAIVPTYDRPALLRECVASLLAQTRPLAEIVVVDDGSTEDVGQALSGLAGPIRVLQQPNRGKSAALNLALRGLKADYVWICDDDDLALADGAERLAGALDADGEAGFAYGSYLRFRDGPGGRRIYGPGYWPAPHDPRDTFHALLDDMFIFQFATMVRRSALKAVGPFREDLVRSVDYEMILRLARRFRAARVEGPIFLQREHGGLRGSSVDRFSASSAAAKWIEYDQKIFVELHRTLALEEYTPREMEAAAPGVRLRSAHLRRGCILARRKLWDLALEDFRSASRLGGEEHPAATELAVAGAALAGKYGCRELTGDPTRLEELAQAFLITPYGAEVARGFARPLRWRARQAVRALRLKEAMECVRALWRLHRPQRAPGPLLRSL